MSYYNKTVDQIMVPINDCPVVREADIVAEAIDTMRRFMHILDGTWFGFQAALVLNSRDKLVGLLTLRGLLRAFQLQQIQDHLLKSDAIGLFFPNKFNDNMQIVVRDIMRPIKTAALNRQSSVFEAVQIMVRKNVNLLPVMDKERMVGMVRPIDLFWVVGEMLD
ncbi:CBS domain-containing protein [Desulfoscipio sp. XC116]|uniref:CBS domain-containing protein n=1 Tax=Desulfoscipio sp. XC116 TaxID=3144975 RepID=UPI00325AFBFF